MDYSRPMSEGQRKLIAQGWTWHEQLRDVLPPGTDEKEIQRRLDRQADLLGKATSGMISFVRSSHQGQLRLMWTAS